jgi:Protein of unknown function DUF262
MKGCAVESMTTFDSTKESLLDPLQSIKQGKTQLPDFQRGWVWDDHHIRDLLASISLSFPIGTVMMLRTGNPHVRFKPRLVKAAMGKQIARDLPQPQMEDLGRLRRRRFSRGRTRCLNRVDSNFPKN